MRKSALLIFILIHVSVYSQSCLPDGIHFQNQYQIDQFSQDYPYCTRIEGPVIIGDYSITDSISSLEGLSQLTSFGAQLAIVGNDNLMSLDGLESVHTIDGALYLWWNPRLTDIDALQSLTTIGDYLALNRIDNLISLEGLSSLTSIGALLGIYVNNSLTSLNGLEQLTSGPTDIRIGYNDNLADISGINNIDPNSISGSVKIFNNPALSMCSNQFICEFMSLSSDSLDVHDNSEGCNNLTEIESNCDTLSVNNQEFEDELVIFPNPTKRFLTFKTPQESKVDEIIIYDMAGQVVMAFASNANTIDISGLRHGVFILELIFEQTSPVRRVIVKD
ncbi:MULTISPECIES: T9SS type A sorting domain-containing protein [unclassified Lentimicrobium]|uniref:T9SS type A sorting domain-containing protein n=1 Tax=unclassified Lentimicrobium TaxID=2677434 RepID=UPI001555B967|nr:MULTISPECIES: T9SS type A sorting domain-containing protein [unclassified Lentimicrobium]NPD44855.1 T9SS type A sorting domain-containing protein [Lentimicrobium sp. S6]NPD83122.1 T9SS type A sorting domain-containing protein [Lentimicrobium sp. L6]